jgi:hypothetical protein
VLGKDAIRAFVVERLPRHPIPSVVYAIGGPMTLGHRR